MTSSLYPETRDENDVVRNLQEIARLRESEDISDFNNLDQRFVRGRGLFEQRAAPSSPSDVLATDQEGDIVNDNTYEYKLLNISGTGLRWDRRTLNVSW
jgi:hypothetical protein